MDQNPPTDNSDNGKLKELEKEVDDLGQKAKEEVSSTPQNPVSGQGGQPSTSDAEQTTQNTPPQNPQDPKKNKNVVVWIAASLLALSLVGVGAYYFSSSKKSATSPSPTPILSTPVVTPDPTVNWETYVNTKFGYSVRLPEDWIIQAMVPGEGVGEPTKESGSVQIIPADQADQSKIIPRFAIETDDPTTHSLYVDHESRVEYLRKNLFFQIDDETNTSVNGVSATFFEGTFTEDGVSTQHKFLVLNTPSKSYFVSIIMDDDVNSSNKEILDQILSTFEFIVASPSSSSTTSPSATLSS